MAHHALQQTPVPRTANWRTAALAAFGFSRFRVNFHGRTGVTPLFAMARICMSSVALPVFGIVAAWACGALKPGAPRPVEGRAVGLQAHPVLLWCAGVALFWVAAAQLHAQQPDTAAARLRGGEPWKTDFARRAVASREIVSGGPPRDGIPAIDQPRFETLRSADRWLSAREPVMVVEHGGEVKAYPLSILIWHEIVNDQVGGMPVAVTFCPLCNTALVFDRRLNGRLLDFGTTGRLRHSDLVMYDRQTETWWQQATGEAIVGVLVGKELSRVPSATLAWKTVKQEHPTARVLSRQTGFDRDYGRNPYRGYDTGRPLSEFFFGGADTRLPVMERVAAVELGKGWAAPFSELRKARIVNAVVASTPLVVFWSPGAASALDQSAIAEGRDVGQTAVYDRRVGDRTLTFTSARGGFRDRETGSGWTMAGRAVSGPLRGQRLRAIPHGNHFWFAWVAFRPRTEVWTAR